MEALEKLQLSLGKLNQFPSSLEGVQNGIQVLVKQMQTVFEAPYQAVLSLTAGLDTLTLEVQNLITSMGVSDATKNAAGQVDLSSGVTTNSVIASVDIAGESSSKLQILHDSLGQIKGQVASLKTLSGDNIMGRVFGESNISAYTDSFSTLKQGLNEQLALWPALDTKVQALSGNLMTQLSPMLSPYIDEVKAMGKSLDGWADKYPSLAQGVNTAEQALGSMMEVINMVGVAQEMLNLAKSHAITLSQNWLVKNLVITPLLKLQAAGVWILNGAMKAMVATGPLLMGLFTSLKAGVLTSLPAIWSFTAALLANPITWIVVGITALIAALVAMVVYWDEVSAAIGRFTDWVFSALSQGFSFIKGLFSDNEWLKLAFFPLYAVIEIVDLLIGVFDRIPQWWGEFQVWLGELSLMPDMSFDFAFIETIKGAWSELKNWLTSLNPFGFIGESADWIKNKFSWLPGVDASPDIQANQGLSQKVAEQGMAQGANLTLPGAESSQTGEQGGLFQSFSNLFASTSKQSHVEKIEVNNYGQGVRGDELAHEMEMQVG
ncbi:hypothetical protein [Marinomonas sp. PE14-40]|uniref:hypothetical protein n=1 Tax=Marinomonas sp. PE14-40 TaxID=3060621 RepID=UPI003F674067